MSDDPTFVTAFLAAVDAEIVPPIAASGDRLTGHARLREIHLAVRCVAK